MSGTCGCASAISAEMNDWTNLGGANWGCCGNISHLYGFHLPAWRVPVGDYSRRHEVAKPVNMNWACAADFAHRSVPNLRARHAALLVRLLRDDPALSMICEFIGQPYPDRPVYYWARWNGTATLQRYTGRGHDTWSHISWWRSRADQRAYLWTPKPTPPAPAPRKPARRQPAKVAPKYSGRLMRRSARFNANVRVWQAQMRSRGWSIKADGYFGAKTLTVVLAFQREKHLGADGIIGPKTWAAAWTAPLTP